ncbi:MAG: TonB-dependent receptor, partial [Rhodanobacter sp.]
MNEHSGRIITTLLAASILFALTHGAHAQEAQNSTNATSQESVNAKKSMKTTELSAVIVTGTRASNRTESSSLTPIDVIPAAVLKQTGTIDLTQALERAIPALNFPFAPASDTFAFQRPFE